VLFAIKELLKSKLLFSITVYFRRVKLNIKKSYLFDIIGVCKYDNLAKNLPKELFVIINFKT
jgi:hypothetical protein